MIDMELVSAPATNITLPSPDLGDGEQYNVKSRFLRTMNGDIHGYKHTPVNSILLMRWSNLNVTERADFTAFLKAVVAQDVKLTLEYLDNLTPSAAAVQEWQGQFVTDPFEFETTGRDGDVCIEVSTITLQFQGVRV